MPPIFLIIDVTLQAKWKWSRSVAIHSMTEIGVRGGVVEVKRASHADSETLWHGNSYNYWRDLWSAAAAAE